MFFSSDNWAGAHPLIAESLVKEASGYAAAYGTSDLDKRIEARFNEIFQREVAVYFVGTGTAANSLALASIAKPGGVTFCHSEAHVTADECGAPEFLTGACRLFTVEGPNGKLEPEGLKAAIGRFPPGAVHQGRPMAVTLTQATESGTVYSLAEIEAIGAVARDANLPLHMDGARFANAIVALQTTAADMTWKRGVDILSFGGTKNGCWCAEAIIFMKPEMATEMPFIRKRSAQLFSKTRFISAQLEAYLEGGLWLDLARHANDMADRLRSGIRAAGKSRLAWDTQSNEVFAVLTKDAAAEAQEKGAKFYEWPVPRETPDLLDENETLIRLVTSFATTPDEVDRFVAVL
ncbi:low specificity L-threonine aldolase [Rhizobium sp. CG5]|uniref:threonine aldolase family protein n=1 Tax=Rhizobium sp. CG5 TaxID=2726076 RepID=UPI0020335BE4|nr:low specificity L-threonine aldolase [Rhizobium sp. CG5]MCM2475935.1 low specificity L-threonine aldolase [Rhizobium sp. CG5]